MREEWKKRLGTVWAGTECLGFRILDSTNEYGKSLAVRRPVHGLLITAQSQTAGKGRRGRTWQSPEGTAVLMSLCVEPEFLPERAAGLTLVMAMAAAEAIRELTGVQPGIKWPNDLVLNGKKICGILTEMVFRKEAYAVILGVGINVNTEQFPKELEETAGSLKTELGRAFSKDALIGMVLRFFEAYYEQYQMTGDLSLLKERYEAFLVNRDKEVRVLDPQHPYQGVAKGITKEGKLIVVDQNNQEQCVDSGEVSVRGILGYT